MRIRLLTLAAAPLLVGSIALAQGAAPAAAPAAPPAAVPPAPAASPAAKPSADELRIERLVPQETLLVASIEKWSDFEARVKRTPLWALWQSKEVQDAVAKAYKSQLGEEGEGDKPATLDSALEEIGLTRDKVVLPENAISGAIFLEMNEEIGQRQIQFLALADYGANADKSQEMVDAILAKAAENDLKPEEKEVRGRTVKSFALPKDPEEMDDAADDEEEDPMDEFGPDVDPSALFSHIQTVHLCRDGQRWFLTTSLVALEDALEVVDGQKLGAPLDADDDFQKTLRQIGESRNAWAVLLTKSIQPLAGELAGGPAAMITPFIGKIFGDIKGYSFGLGVDGKEGMAEQAVGIYAPGAKAGLLALLESRPKGSLPRHVGADAIGYGRINVKFAGLMPLVNDIVKSIPPAFAEQIEMQLEQFGPPLEKGFADLGPEVHVATTLAEPITAQSRKLSVAVRAEKPDGVKPMVDLFAPMLGLAPQDFLGNTIWADEFAPAALGLGGGWLLLGEQSSVEAALRSAGQKEAGALGEDKGFARAFALVPDGDLVGWGWANPIAGFRYERVAMKAELEELKQILGPEAAAELEKEGMDGLLDGVSTELLEKHIGPSAWWMKAIDDGFLYRGVLLAPQ